MFSKPKNIFILLVILLCFTRFLKINWGNNFFFHPDESNMARAISQLSPQNLDPGFYAYGQFPLYIVYFIFKFFNFWFNPSLSINLSFIQAVFGLRILSAIFSCFTAYFIYLISKIFFKKPKYQLLLFLFIILNPGLIQIAHFGTTESILSFVLVFNIYMALMLHEKIKLKYIFWSALVTGIGIGSKITALIFILPIIISLKFNLLLTAYYLLTTGLFSILSTPYYLINFSEFISSMNYETGVATGKIKVFYTNQFLHTIPYLFQLQKIFPYVTGISTFILSIFGFLLFIKKKLFNQKYFIFLIPCLIYFIYFGQLYTKWVRFMAPIFFIFPFFAVLFISKIKSEKLFYLLTILCLTPGLLFINLYLRPDIRLQASKWIDQNIVSGKTILSEGGNVINIPINTNNHFKTINFDFYSLENSIKNQEELRNYQKNADYVLIPSRRVFKNQKGISFPFSSQYYKDLFSGKSGFKSLKTFQIKNYFLLDPENAEETWTVFDHPKIRLYQKIE